MESKLAELSGLNPEILERLGRRVNLLVHEFPLNLVGRHDRPPEVLVQVVSHRLEHGLGQVDVTTVLDDFPVHQSGNLSHRVVLGSVELIRLSHCGVVVQHVLESSANVGGLNQ